MAKNKIERIDQEIAKTREKMRSSWKCFNPQSHAGRRIS